jgi:hypothetical protein
MDEPPPIGTPFYFVAHDYDAASKVVRPARTGHHPVTWVKSDAVACLPVEPKKGKRKRSGEAAPRAAAKRPSFRRCFWISVEVASAV